MTPAPDERAITDYLQTVFDTAIQTKQSAFLVVTHSAGWLSDSFALDELDQAAHWLTQTNKFADVYYRVNLVGSPPQGGGRGVFEDNAFVTHFSCDVDFGQEGHSSKTLVPGLEEAKEVVLKTLTPSRILHSGGGVYGIYLLKEPFDVRDQAANERAKRIGQALDAALNRHGETDTTNNGAHVIRPCGSVNHKRKTLATVHEIYASEKRYTIDELEAALGVADEKTRTPGLLTASETLLTKEWRPTKVGAQFNADPNNTWLAILQADEVTWQANGRTSKGDEIFFAENSSTRKSATIENDRFYIHSTTVAARLGVEGGARLDKFGLAARILGRHPKELADELIGGRP